MARTDVKRYGMPLRDCLIEANDLGIVNRHITLNGWKHDIAQIRGLFAPPYFCRNFRLELRFDGRRVPATDGFWQGNEIRRTGTLHGLTYESNLVLAAGTRGAILEVTIHNRTHKDVELPVQYEVYGELRQQQHWEFNFPQGEGRGTSSADGQGIAMDSTAGRIRIASSLPLQAGAKEIYEAGKRLLPAGEKGVFYTVLAVGTPEAADALAQNLLQEPAGAIKAARNEWHARIRNMESRMPRFTSDSPELNRLYDRSLLHLLLNEWDVPEWQLHPYYATGSINGGCCCSYLWNYGEPYQLWSLLDTEAAKQQLLVYLKTDLCNGFAFHPDDGSLFGPYYPVNQEKVLLLAYAYVTQESDAAFLNEDCNGRRVIEILCDQAMMHDDLSQKAVLVNYGDGNHHLELRGKLRYDGILPDLNLRRCVNYHLADILCRKAGYQPPVDFIQRAEDLKALIEEKLFDEKSQWFQAIDMQGKPYLRYTMQLFKALGWEDWCLSERTKNALLSHLNEEEFLGRFGMHSLSRKDPAYDPSDVDNGGPGACISFAPAVVDRLYRDGEPDRAWDILQRLLWLGEALPYWGDSQMADRMEYRRDTPLQNDIQGAALAQSIIFGLFGIRIREDGTIEISPELPPNCKWMKLENLWLFQKDFVHTRHLSILVSDMCLVSDTWTGQECLFPRAVWNKDWWAFTTCVISNGKMDYVSRAKKFPMESSKV